ncbi:TPA: bifunctional 4-hydroxy-2-oxoglutarate aldolase/2-dehydro-3-deoxy-phosphogluconate aldolase [Vibrio harveyi]|uniref:bifunctional 4-hydroxy-2-oxoglutarate aldolase/2-dehydro-3-deoxy-phosphogluconate aldolase n=1 Tax=Vibrio harveyi TaxID=669 RepID=UPI0009382F83|nr:bifunctional 4-hydroxy-2-oxoglutarate aldolase/2-dehydro-3-deoxy-phosphogluconate aldolase [Vibrio harveyi]APP08100.1 2-dehydro-3-deoxyphosphogluconate aldolase [Vibrio harveyi]EKO3803676.1 bifunctional 4-hydroxy-2-oxoglutarate aldolase/2-dehydro-3-deoxy-phosphogluconate aldolase [Vibrio harveyi]EKY4193692.1 bifunctional 4-hydroxy-2-oxoglutarate aldolase/2-dehydro-3-deoxy-phosphogluconate aldolase [Vibrio harveyi]HDM8167540.1 bifunctional 4-hydroxy-2-oxoglutarate aldolase/2-dehydro-3-deoxy-p
MSDLKALLAKYKVIPVIAVDNAEDILPLGDQLVENGLPVAEITFRSAAAAKAIRLLRAKHPDMLIGAGTVLNEAQVLAAKEAGASFIVSPGLNPNTVKACQKHQIAIVPGVNTPSQIEQAIELGLDTVKFFPAEPSGGLAMLKAMLAPYNAIKVMPTGGININNIHEYLAVPAVLACGGSWMVDKKLVNNGKWTEIGHLISEIVDEVNR